MTSVPLFIIYGIGGLMGMLFLIYIYLLITKILSSRVRLAKDSWLERNAPMIESYLAYAEDSCDIQLRKKYEFEAFEDYLSDYLEIFQLGSKGGRIKDLTAVSLTERYRKLLYSNRWSARMNSLFFIRLFRMDHLLEEVLTLLSSRHCTPKEQYEIYLFLAEVHNNHAVDLILKSNRSLPDFMLRELLDRFISLENFEEYIVRFHQYPRDWRLCMVDVFRDKNLRSQPLFVLLETIALQEDHELRLRAMKAIAALGYVTSPSFVVELFNKVCQNGVDTADKILLSRIMGEVRYSCFIPLLEHLIKDKSYLVRNESAKSIRKYKGGIERLLRIADTHADGFARDAALEWIEREVVHE